MPQPRQGLEAFEDQLNLPAQAAPLQDPVGEQVVADLHWNAGERLTRADSPGRGELEIVARQRWQPHAAYSRVEPQMGKAPPFELLTRPTELQQRAFELLGVKSG